MSRWIRSLRRAFAPFDPFAPSWTRASGSGKRSFAHNELDLKLERYLPKHRGIFVEAGANNGVNQSNTLYFEKYYRWQGLLIEPIPELFIRCRRHRPYCTVVNAALVPLGFPDSTVTMHACNLMSIVKGAMRSPDADADHVRRGGEIQNIETHEVKVPAMALSDILDQHGIRDVDFLSLDVEGYELPALQGLDFVRHRPAWMLVEARFRDEVDAFLDPLYECVDVLSHHDVLYRLRDA